MEKPLNEEEVRQQLSSSIEPPPGSTSYPTCIKPFRSTPIDPFDELIRVIKSALWSTGFISFICLLILSVAILFAATPGIQDWISTPSESGEMPNEVLFLLIPLPVGILQLDGMSLQFWHLLMLSILAICFFYGFYRMCVYWSSKKNGLAESFIVPEKARSGLEGVAKLFMAVSFFTLSYYLILEMFKVSQNVPPFDELSTNELIFRLFNASVYEEFISRLLLIGVPLLLIAQLLRWKRPHYRLLFGGGMRMNFLTTSLIIISTLIFAFGHIGSWDFWKVPQVFVSGMALGYAFVRFGLFASILLHFSVNLITSSATEIWPENQIVLIVIGMAFLIWVLAGSYFFIDYSFRFMRKLKSIAEWYVGDGTMPTENAIKDELPSNNKDAGRPYRHPALNASQPRPEGEHTHSIRRGFVCPFCGNITAKYKDKKFICLKCGKSSSKSEHEEVKIDMNNDIFNK